MRALTHVIENTLDEVAADIQADFNVTTHTWKHRPAFYIRSFTGKREIYTTDAIYSYVSHGTQAHVIRPRNARRLHFFRTGFRAKSRPGYIGANQGAAASSDETFARVVHHPGNAARGYDEAIGWYTISG